MRVKIADLGSACWTVSQFQLSPHNAGFCPLFSDSDLGVCPSLYSSLKVISLCAVKEIDLISACNVCVVLCTPSSELCSVLWAMLHALDKFVYSQI